MRRWLRVLALAIGTFLLAVSPVMRLDISDDRNVFGVTNDEQILNILRAKSDTAVHFGEISTNIQQTANIQETAPFGELRDCTRRIGGKPIPYIVVGTGGMTPQKRLETAGQPADESQKTTFDAGLSALGYLFVTAFVAKRKSEEFWKLGNQRNEAFGAVSVDIATYTISRG